jgi:hypothetical protein
VASFRPILSGLVGALIATAVGALIRRSRPVVAGDGALVLRYPRALGVFGLMIGGVFGAFAVRNAIYGNAVNSYAMAVAVPLVLALLGFYLAAEGFVVRVILSETGVQATTLWGTRAAPWSDIVEVTSSSSDGGYVLHTRAAGRLKVGGMLAGTSALPEHLAKRGIPVVE